LSIIAQAQPTHTLGSRVAVLGAWRSQTGVFDASWQRISLVRVGQQVACAVKNILRSLRSVHATACFHFSDVGSWPASARSFSSACSSCSPIRPASLLFPTMMSNTAR
jgi:hypothetical protein